MWVKFSTLNDCQKFFIAKLENELSRDHLLFYIICILFKSLQEADKNFFPFLKGDRRLCKDFLSFSQSLWPSATHLIIFSSAVLLSTYQHLVTAPNQSFWHQPILTACQEPPQVTVPQAPE